MDKNVPMKPFRVNGEEYGKTIVEYCPRCRKMICPDIKEKMFECNFCHRCGQALSNT